MKINNKIILKTLFFLHTFFKFLYIPVSAFFIILLTTKIKIQILLLIFPIFIIITIISIFNKKLYFKFLNYLHPKLLDNYPYLKNKKIKNDISKKITHLIKNNKNYLLNKTTSSFKKTFISIILFLSFLSVYPSLFFNNLKNNKNLIPVYKQFKHDFIEGEKINFFFYYPEKTDLKLKINSKTVLQLKGKTIKYSYKTNKKNLNIEYIFDDRKINQKIKIIKKPVFTDEKITILPPEYIKKYNINLQNKVLKNSKINLKLKSTKKIPKFILKDRNNNILNKYNINSKKISINFLAEKNYYNIYYTFKNKTYFYTSYNFNIVEDNPPQCLFLNYQPSIFSNNKKNLSLKLLFKDDFYLNKGYLKTKNNIIKKFKLNSNKKIISAKIKNIKKLKNKEIFLKVWDIKNQTNKSKKIAIKEISEDEIQQYLSKTQSEQITNQNKNIKNINKISKNMKDINKNIKLNTKLKTKDKKRLKEIKKNLKDIDNSLKKSKKLLSSKEKEFIDKHYSKKIQDMMREIEKLLKEMNFDKMEKTSQKLKEKSKNFKKSMENLLKTLKRQKFLQDIEKSIKQIKKAKTKKKIQKNLKSLKKGNPEYKNNIKKIENKYKKTKNKKQLLNQLNKLKDKLSGQLLREFKKTLLSILKKQIIFSEKFENSLKNNTFNKETILSLKPILKQKLEKIYNYKSVFLFLHPSVLKYYETIQFDINEFLNKKSSYLKPSFKNILYKLNKINKYIILSLNYIEQQKSQINLSKAMKKMQKIKKQQKKLNQNLIKLPSKKLSKSEKKLLKQLMNKQKNLKSSLNKLQSSIENKQLKKLINKLKDSMNKIIKEKNLEKKKQKMKHTSIELEKITKDWQAEKKSKKRRRELIDKIIKSKGNYYKENKELNKLILKYINLIEKDPYKQDKTNYYNSLME